MSETSEGAWNIFACPIWYLGERDGILHVSLDSDEECVVTKKNTMSIHESWTRSTRKSSAAELEFKQDHPSRGKCAVIVLETKNIVIDFERDVGHCVLCASNSSIRSEGQRIQ